MRIENIKKATGLLREGMQLLATGPLDYYLTELVAAHDLLMDRYAPFKVGDKVELAVTPTISEEVAWGWLGAKHFLKKGATGVVVSATCGARGFRFGVVFDEETWISPVDKLEKEVEKDKRHEYVFGESSLTPCTGGAA